VSISVKSISLSINGTKSIEWYITLDAKYHLDNFMLRQSLLSPSVMTFTLNRDPDETAGDPRFDVCGQIIGKEVDLTLQVMTEEKGNEHTDDIKFKGFVYAAYGSRCGTEYYVNVEARSWDALLDDNPACKSFEDKTLNDIVEDITDDYSGNISPIIDTTFTDEIPYCVQYNETNYQFLQRLARRHGEWLYNTGTQMIFGKLPEGKRVDLKYPSKEIPSYSVDLRMQHVAFNHLASSYNSFDSNQKDGVSEMMRRYNDLNESVFQASQERYTKQTLQNLHSGGFAKAEREDSRETVLNISTKTQARAEKANMLTYSGTTYCPKLKIGGTLSIEDNYLVEVKRSAVEQDVILITELVHHFSLDNTYSNHFAGIPEACDYPPYSNSDIYPIAPSCRATVKDNEDPEGLGRIRVQFDWQIQLSQETGEELMTPWLRMAQPYAGGGKGFSFIPEIGEEVMVDFEGGNAERPFVKGTLYNGVDDVDNKWVANGNSQNQIKAIRTRNGHTIEVHDEGNDGYIRIYDNEKENYILTFSTDRKLIMLESTGNIELYAKNDIIMHAGHDISATADHDMRLKVGNDRTLDVGMDDSTTVGNNQSVKVGNDQENEIGNDQETTIQSNNNIKIGGDQVIDIKGNKDERVVNTSYLNAKDYREEIDDEVIVVANSQQYKSSSFTKIDGGNQVDIKATVTKVN